MSAEDTIVAIATPQGRGGIGIVRLSGNKAALIAQKIANTERLSPRKVTFQTFYQPNQEIIDKGLLLYFKAPHSFTGEDIIEFQGHGSPVALDMLVTTCLAWGARLARPGEFSERAFLNDKMDLVQAEAIFDLIHASSQKAARLALNSLQGEFSHLIEALNVKLIHLRMYVEAAIDFPEEEIDFLSDGKVAAMLNEILAELGQIRKNAAQGVLLREGLSVVIAGEPNVGKSTLINLLAKRDVAIVTDIAGTTRDVMREHILLDDLPIHIIDTAGLRDSDDLVEQEGIKRAWQEVHRADCILLIKDINQADSISPAVKNILASEIPVITVFNKIDTYEEGSYSCSNDSIYLSAKTGVGLEDLKAAIKAQVNFHPEEGLFLARRRHLDALDKAETFLLQGQQQLILRAGELLAEDLRQAHEALNTITGKFTSDDLLGQIFSSFCIGK